MLARICRQLAVPVVLVAIGVCALVADRATAPAAPATGQAYAAQLRRLLDKDAQHVLGCSTHGRTTTCELARGGRCEQTIGGAGQCVAADGRVLLELGGGVLHTGSP